jgi:hypothetical protein
MGPARLIWVSSCMRRMWAARWVSAVAWLGAARDDLAVPGESAERGVHLPERQLLAASEEGAVVALEVVAVARFPFEQAEQSQRNAHIPHSTLSVYTEQVSAL